MKKRFEVQELIYALVAGLLIGTFLCIFACGRGPTAPEVLAEQYDQAVGSATVHVLSVCEAPIDRARVADELATAARRIESEGSTVDCIDGMVMMFTPKIDAGHAGQVPYGQVAIGCGAYGAVEHEPGHWCAHWGSPRHHCWSRMWHGSFRLGSCEGSD